jgi:hypothetical protein
VWQDTASNLASGATDCPLELDGQLAARSSWQEVASLRIALLIMLLEEDLHMRYVHFFTLAMLTLGAVSASAQQRLAPEQKADSDALRALTKVVPLLPMERIELKPPGPEHQARSLRAAAFTRAA